MGLYNCTFRDRWRIWKPFSEISCSPTPPFTFNQEHPHLRYILTLNRKIALATAAEEDEKLIDYFSS